MRHERGMLDETLDATQTFGQSKQATALEKAPGVIERSRKLGGNHAAERLHLLFRKRVLRMTWKTRVEYPTHFGMAFEPAGNLQGRGAVAFHAQRKRLQTTQSEE